MNLPHAFKRITFHLARSSEHPNGSDRHGYDLVAPLDAQGKIDADAWRARRGACRVRRFWHGEPDQIGHLVHRAGGAGGHSWIFDYDPDSDDDDEVAFRFGDHKLQVGEYVSIEDDRDEMHTLRIVSVINAD